MVFRPVATYHGTFLSRPLARAQRDSFLPALETVLGLGLGTSSCEPEPFRLSA